MAGYMSTVTLSATEAFLPSCVSFVCCVQVLWSGRGTRGRAGGCGYVLWCQGGVQKQQLKGLAHMTGGGVWGLACQKPVRRLEEELSLQLASEGKRPPSLWQVTCFTLSLLQMAVPC